MTNEDSVAGPGPGGKPGDFCATPTASELSRLFQICQLGSELGIVTGEPGVGKTTAARHYVETTRQAYLVTMSPATSAVVPCLTRVGQGIGACPSQSGAYAWSDAIRRWLNVEAEPKLLLIDEAHHLCDDSVEELRAIYDATDLGLVFIGSREIRERWSGRRWAQLTSRVFQRLDIEGPEAGDIDAICDAVGITGKRPRERMRSASRGPGGLRVVAKMLGAAATIAGSGNPIAGEHVEAAFRAREAAQ